MLIIYVAGILLLKYYRLRDCVDGIDLFGVRSKGKGLKRKRKREKREKKVSKINRSSTKDITSVPSVLHILTAKIDRCLKTKIEHYIT